MYAIGVELQPRTCRPKYGRTQAVTKTRVAAYRNAFLGLCVLCLTVVRATFWQRLALLCRWRFHRLGQSAGMQIALHIEV